MTHTTHNIVVHGIKNINYENKSMCSLKTLFFPQTIAFIDKTSTVTIDLFVIFQEKDDYVF